MKKRFIILLVLLYSCVTTEKIQYGKVTVEKVNGYWVDPNCKHVKKEGTDTLWYKVGTKKMIAEPNEVFVSKKVK